MDKIINVFTLVLLSLSTAQIYPFKMLN